jgi:hypothetical protein
MTTTANGRAVAIAAASQLGVRYEERDVDPTYAESLLANHNTHNRPLNPAAVNAYAHDMAAGKWNPSVDAIALSPDGVILNGQHRLAAVVKSGATVRMLFGLNIPAAAQETMDAGRKRTFANTLSLRGEENYAGVAAVTRLVWAWEKGERLEPLRVTPTGAQLSETIDRYPAIRRSAAVGNGFRSSGLPVSPSALGLCHWLFSTVDDASSRHFFGRLVDGANLGADDPINVLRRTLINQRTAKTTMRPRIAIAFVIKAWNAHRDGRTLRFLRLQLAGDNPESFPEPR